MQTCLTVLFQHTIINNLLVARRRMFADMIEWSISTNSFTMNLLGCTPQSSSKLQSIIALAFSDENPASATTREPSHCSVRQSRDPPPPPFPPPDKTSDESHERTASLVNMVQVQEGSQSWPKTNHDLRYAQRPSIRRSHDGNVPLHQRVADTTRHDNQRNGDDPNRLWCLAKPVLAAGPSTPDHTFHHPRATKSVHADLPPATDREPRIVLVKEEPLAPKPHFGHHDTVATTTSMVAGSPRGGGRYRRRSPAIAIPQRPPPDSQAAEADIVEQIRAVREYNTATWRLYHRIMCHRQSTSQEMRRSIYQDGGDDGSDITDDGSDYAFASIGGKEGDLPMPPERVETSCHSTTTFDEEIFVMDL
jgi:hypothetical protein